MATNITIKKELFDYVKRRDTLFYWYHNPQRINDWNKDVPVYKKAPVKIIINNDGTEAVIHNKLNDFFEATLDEARLKDANEFSTFALKISDNGTLAYFRVAASKREFAADIDYNMQRDHAVHTLYNYILGWCFFDYSEKFQEEFRDNLEKKNDCFKKHDPFKLELQKGESDFYRKYNRLNKYGGNKEINKGIEESNIVLADEFGDVWCITSLLHDIGYILEGTISSASTEVENIRVNRGSKIIHDYFNHRFWNDTSIDFRAVQGIGKVLGVSFPDFRTSKSLASLGDHLCDVGFCENIRKKLEKLPDFKNSKSDNINSIIQPYGLNREAFFLWKTYHEVYADTTTKYYKDNSKSKMCIILDIVKKEYYDAMWKGTNQGYRNLNHGVCSGLITLQALSFFYDFMFGFTEHSDWSEYEVEYERLTKKGCLNELNTVQKQSFLETKDFMTITYLPQQIKARGGRNADFWFNKVLWATASVAIHDVIQQKYYEKISKEHDDKESVKIEINDDPLAFLGILVDALQEWDRYTVSGESAFSDKELLLQSTDVYVDPTSGKISIYYPCANNESEKDFYNEIKKVMDRCLLNWRDIVSIGIKFSCPHCGFSEDLEEKDIELNKEKEIELECGYIKNNKKTTGSCKNIMERSKF